ncbi:head-tail connector protein [Sphingomonas echinoides]|uniref:head-tail connector protein n=1 Tax=Sphingomonas echinoides TaxID=59803 RepID=UPI0024135BD7|nr:head-tail connector protein [Sphingomonas echinoides]
MTVDQMRVIIGAGSDVSDADVIIRYGAFDAAQADRGLAIEEVRAQVRLERTDASEDSYLNLLILAAARAVRNELKRPVDLTLDDPDNDVIKVAMLLLIGHWFDKREPVAVGSQSSELPFTVTFLLDPIRKWVC